MSSQAALGYGSLFEMFDTGEAAFFAVGEVTSINLPKLSRDSIEVTAINSPDGYKEFIPGLKDAGEVSIEMNLVPGSNSDAFIREQFKSGATVQGRITLPSPGSPSEQLTFNAFITGYEGAIPVADKMTATVTFKVTGAVAYTGSLIAMANAIKGEVPFTVDGKPYTLSLSVGALMHLESLTGHSANVTFSEYADPVKLKYTTQCQVFWAALQDQHKGITLEQVSELMSALGRVEYMSLTTKAIQLAFPEIFPVRPFSGQGGSEPAGWDWHGILSTWLEFGLDYDLFWRLTPRLVLLSMEAAAQRQASQHDEYVWLAWSTARLYHSDPRKFPPLKTLMVGRRVRRPRQSIEQQREMLRAIARIHGTVT